MQQCRVNYVHETMSQYPTGRACDRQRELVLAMPTDRALKRDELAGLTPQLAQLYAPAGPRTLSRDLNRLEQAGLIERDKREIRAAIHQLAAFLPPIANESPLE